MVILLSPCHYLQFLPLVKKLASHLNFAESPALGAKTRGEDSISFSNDTDSRMALKILLN